MPYDPYALTIHIDGSALNNPGGPGGIAGVVEYPDRALREPEVIFQQGYLATTNNRMELRACIEALSWARWNEALLTPSRIVILTDSLYVHDHQRRALQWKTAGWTNYAGRMIENPDLWKTFLSTRSKIKAKVSIEWRKGKSNEISNRVDRLAKDAAKGDGKIVDDGFRESDVSRTELPGDAATLFHACGQEELVRIYRKTLVGRGPRAKCKISFDLLSAEGTRFTAKHFAYTSPQIGTNLHRHHTYRVKFDDNSGNPNIESVIEEIAPS